MYMSSGTDRRKAEGSSTPVIPPITDKKELQEIQKIAGRLGKDEKVIFVARQSRFKPGGSKGTPATFFVTSQRLIVRNPSMMGLREKFSSVNYDRIASLNIEKGFFSSTLKITAQGFSGDIGAIDKKKAEVMLSYIGEKMVK